MSQSSVFARRYHPAYNEQRTTDHGQKSPEAASVSLPPRGYMKSASWPVKGETQGRWRARSLPGWMQGCDKPHPTSDPDRFADSERSKTGGWAIRPRPPVFPDRISGSASPSSALPTPNFEAYLRFPAALV